MPRLEEHLSASHENQDLATTLISTPGGVSWAPVVAFYAALHLVDAYLATIGIHPRSHVERRAAIRQTHVLAPILRDYRILEALSRESRYDLRRFSAAEARGLLEGELKRVRDGIDSLLS